MTLTDKQQRFVEEYAIDFNGTQAAMRAGYAQKSARFTARDLLDKPEIFAAIAALQKKHAERCDISAERVIRELALLGFSNILDYMTAPEGADPYIDLSAMTRDQAAALTEVTCERYFEGKGDDATPVVRTKIKVADKRGALELLGKHLSVFKDASPVNLNVEGAQVQIYLPDNGRD